MATSKKKEETKQPEEKKTLNTIIASINKKQGENVIGRISEMEHIQVERIPTGIKKLDDAVGGGFPLRRVVELYGIPSGGKSLISLLIIKGAQKMGLDCIYVDVEDTFTPEFAESLGVDTKKLVIAQSAIGEDILDLVCKLLEAEPGVIVVDSVAAMITRGEMEEDLDKAFMAPKARLMSKALARITALNKNTLVVFINQLRATMALYGPQTTTTGGRALGHYASIRMEIKKAETLHEDDKKTKDIIGQLIAFNVTKNKTAAPFKTGSLKYFYEGTRIEE